MTILQLKITVQVVRFKCQRAKCEHYAKNLVKYFSVRNGLIFSQENHDRLMMILKLEMKDKI